MNSGLRMLKQNQEAASEKFQEQYGADLKELKARDEE